MTTPPRPDRAAYDAALARIHDRRRRAGDDHPLALSDDPREVLAYLRQRGRGGLRTDHTGDDVTDALTLRLWLWWEGESTELWLLDAAEHLARNRKTIGAVLGLTHGQSLIDRIARLRDKLGRTQVPAPAATSPAATPSRDYEIRALAAELVARRAELPEDVDPLYLDSLADALRDWPDGAPPPRAGVLPALRLLLADLVDEVPTEVALRDLVDRGAELVGVRG